ncbi:hypothetical protein GQ53DRAFT_750450 [Thozetella sp. PMI_491]|nr:hypothetical protein GQ53DRAFT_750450 [Thozetella sp. PMI_491]
MDEPDSQPQHPRPKVTNACEACRSAKVKCQASNQLGICRRCLDSKRECIFKTGPRTRRPRQSKLSDPATVRPPPPPAPSKTFTIDIPVSVDEDVHETWDALRSQHEDILDKLVPDMSSEGEDEWFDAPSASTAAPSVVGSGISGSSLPLGASATHTPPSSVASRQTGKRTASTMGLQPQFNVESATALLQTFREPMLTNFPCIVLPAEATVASLAKDKPFVLLAILASASSSTSLQGYSLYDEEFRKILGLKFVAGGERSLELLQGLVIYISWYPFHLRPRNRVAFQYIRMAVDIVSDLDLDQEPYPENPSVRPTDERLEEIRTYLAAYHMVCTFATTWNRTPTLQYSPYVRQCCDVLEKQGQGKGDLVLSWQVRVQRIIEETSATRRNTKAIDAAQAYQHALMVKGMEAELTHWQAIMPPEISSTLCIRVHFLLARIFLTAAPLLKIPMPKRRPADGGASLSNLVLPEDLRSKIPALKELFDLYTQQPPECINAFSCICWSYLIISIIVGFRISFALPECVGWDDAAARRELDFGGYLERMCHIGEQEGEDGLPPPNTKKNMDILAAIKVVLRAMMSKYQKRVARLERHRLAKERAHAAFADAGMGDDLAAVGAGLNFLSSDPMQLDKTVAGCPMMDGSLEAYYPLWDETFPTPDLTGGTTGGVMGDGSGPSAGTPGIGGMSTTAQPAPYNDIWAAMTMGWAQNEINFDDM